MTDVLIEVPPALPSLQHQAATDFVAVDDALGFDALLDVEPLDQSLDQPISQPLGQTTALEERMHRRERLLHQLALERRRQRRRRSA